MLASSPNGTFLTGSSSLLAHKPTATPSAAHLLASFRCPAASVSVRPSPEITIIHTDLEETQ
jgi:hypothetical protein